MLDENKPISNINQNRNGFFGLEQTLVDLNNNNNNNNNTGTNKEQKDYKTMPQAKTQNNLSEKLDSLQLSTSGEYLNGKTFVGQPKFDDLQQAYRKLIEASGEDINRDGLSQTPARAAKAFQFFTAGYQMNLRGK